MKWDLEVLILMTCAKEENVKLWGPISGCWRCLHSLCHPSIVNGIAWCSLPGKRIQVAFTDGHVCYKFVCVCVLIFILIVGCYLHFKCGFSRILNCLLPVIILKMYNTIRSPQRNKEQFSNVKLQLCNPKICHLLYPHVILVKTWVLLVFLVKLQHTYHK